MRAGTTSTPPGSRSWRALPARLRPRLPITLAAATVAVTGLALLAPAADAAVHHNPIGYLDSVSVRVSDGTVAIVGWTADLDGPASARCG